MPLPGRARWRLFVSGVVVAFVVTIPPGMIHQSPSFVLPGAIPGYLVEPRSDGGGLRTDQLTGAIPRASPGPASAATCTFYPECPNGTLDHSIEQIDMGPNPYQGVFLNSTDTVYMPDSGSSSLTLYGVANDTVYGSIAVGSSPVQPGYDPLTRELYVPNYGSSNISVVSTASDRVVANLKVPSYPTTPTFDPKNGYLYETNTNSLTGSNELTVIRGTNHTYAKNVSLPAYTGSNPSLPTLDPQNGWLYIALSSSLYGVNWVETVNGTDNIVMAEIDVGHLPLQPVFDPLNDLMYVANEGSSNISVINTTTNTVVSAIDVGADPREPTFDPSYTHLYVPMPGSNGVGNVTVVDPTNGSILARIPTYGSDPQPPVYDPADNELYVADRTDGNVTAIMLANDTPRTAIHFATLLGFPIIAAQNDLMFFATATYVEKIYAGPITLSVLLTPPKVLEGGSVLVDEYFGGGWGGLDMNITGLPTGCVPWYATEQFCTPTVPGTYDIQFNLSDSSGAYGTNSTVLTVLAPSSYPLVFTEAGLPSGTNWSVAIGGAAHYSLSNAMNFTETNGSYAYTVPNAAGLIPSPSSGTAHVHGAAQGVAIVFAPPPPPRYTVGFTAVGLASGVSWSVTLNGTMDTSIYPSITFSELNGTYAFTVGTPSGYTVNRTSGNVGVAGSPQFVSIGFTAIPGQFTATGSANVTGVSGGGLFCIDGTGQVGSHPFWLNVTYRAHAENGTAPYTFSWAFGDGSPSSAGPEVNHSYSSDRSWVANLTVTDSKGNSTTAQVPLPGPISTPPPAVPDCTATTTPASTPWTEYALIVGGLAVVAAVAGVLAVRRRKRPPAS